MRRARTARSLTAAALAAGLLVAASASAAPAEDSTRFFLGQDGCSDPGRLSVTAGTDDGAHGCSWYGLPLDEVFYQADGAVLGPLEYATVDGMPLVLDALRDVSGVISTVSDTAPVGGVGEVVVDVELYGTRIGTNGRPQSVALGSGTFTTSALPTQSTYAVPFELDVPDALAGATFTALQLTANIRGTNVNASGQSLNGTSFLDVPTLVDDGS